LDLRRGGSSNGLEPDDVNKGSASPRRTGEERHHLQPAPPPKRGRNRRIHADAEREPSDDQEKRRGKNDGGDFALSPGALPRLKTSACSRGAEWICTFGGIWGWIGNGDGCLRRDLGWTDLRDESLWMILRGLEKPSWQSPVLHRDRWLPIHGLASPKKS
jgi:hypothetical protein